jgi:hypothetical protein
MDHNLFDANSSDQQFAILIQTAWVPVEFGILMPLISEVRVRVEHTQSAGGVLTYVEERGIIEKS